MKVWRELSQERSERTITGRSLLLTDARRRSERIRQIDRQHIICMKKLNKCEELAGQSLADTGLAAGLSLPEENVEKFRRNIE